MKIFFSNKYKKEIIEYINSIENKNIQIFSDIIENNEIFEELKIVNFVKFSILEPEDDQDIIHIPTSDTLQALNYAESKDTEILCLNEHFQIVVNLYKKGFRNFCFFNSKQSKLVRIDHTLNSFINRHKGERCYIVGNGPSLNNIDLRLLKDEITFGSNRCFLGFEKWGFEFNYWAIVDRLQIEYYNDEYEKNLPKEMVKFFPFEYLSYLCLDNICPINHIYDVVDYPKFSNSPDKIYLGHSVTFTLMQIASVLGFNEMILLGVDHHYELKSNNSFKNKALKKLKQLLFKNEVKSFNYWKKSDSKSQTHFDKRYTNNRKIFIPPRPPLMEQAYKCAHDWSNSQNIKILNATPGSKLKIFEQIKYESLF